jgi:putative tryptophan/tyrosine transport system substrate-binding protein
MIWKECLRAWQAVSDSIRLPIETVSAGSEKDFEPAIASLADKQVDGVFVLADSLFGSYRRDLIAVLARHAMPAMFASRQNVVDGGLISYGGSRDEAHRQTGIYAGQFSKATNLRTCRSCSPPNSNWSSI